MQPVIWIVQLNDGSVIQEFDKDGKETVFNEDVLKRRNDFRYIGLVDVVNDLSYSIDLQNGKFILRGQAFGVGKELDGRVYDVTSVPNLDFRSGVIQFKCSKPMLILAGKQLPDKASPATFNVGYKVDLPDRFCAFRKGNSVVNIVKCQALLSIDSESLCPSLAFTFLAKMIDPSGQEVFLKL